MAPKKKSNQPNSYKLTKDGRTWETTDRTEVTNLRARGWKVEKAPESPVAEPQTPPTPSAPSDGKTATN